MADTDDQAFRCTTSLDADIAEEERRIGILQAELALLRRQSTKRRAVCQSWSSVVNERQDLHEEDDPLDSILLLKDDYNDTTNVSLAQKVSVLLTEEQSSHVSSEVQAALLGFCFTSVSRVEQKDATKKTTAEAIDTSSRQETEPKPINCASDGVSLHEYELKGYFLDRDSLTATIRMILNIHPSRTPCIMALTCQIDREPSQGLFSRFDFTVHHGRVGEAMFGTCSRPNHSLGLWVQTVQQYLCFDNKRRQLLESLLDNDPDIQVSHPSEDKDGTVVLNIPVSSSDTSGSVPLNDSLDEEKKTPDTPSQRCISISWKWSLKDRRDYLILSIPSDDLGLRQDDLNDLVSVTGSCGKALALLLGSESESPVTQMRQNDTENDVTTSRTTNSPQDYADADDEQSQKNDRGDSDDSSYGDEGSVASESAAVETTRVLSDYELLRLERIKRNEHRLKKLGLAHHTLKPLPATEAKSPAKTQSQTKRKPKRRPFSVKRRTSSRLNGTDNIRDDLFR